MKDMLAILMLDDSIPAVQATPIPSRVFTAPVKILIVYQWGRETLVRSCNRGPSDRFSRICKAVFTPRVSLFAPQTGVARNARPARFPRLFFRAFRVFAL